MSIVNFRGDYDFLSNFHPAKVTYDGVEYPSVEHAYQAAKTIISKERTAFKLISMSPGQAKRRGKKVTLRADWTEVKLPIMKDLVRQKFTNHPHLKKKLLETGKKHIEEGNYWGDIFWGTCGGEGLNHLGKILMKVREELKLNNGSQI